MQQEEVNDRERYEGMTLKSKPPPWAMKPLDEWSIIGMNHYWCDGEKMLFVALGKDGQFIKEEGSDNGYLWNRLWHKAKAIEEKL